MNEGDLALTLKKLELSPRAVLAVTVLADGNRAGAMMQVKVTYINASPSKHNILFKFIFILNMLKQSSLIDRNLNISYHNSYLSQSHKKVSEDIKLQKEKAEKLR